MIKAILYLTVIFYVATSVMAGDFNPLKWPVGARAFVGFVWLVVVLAASAIISMNNEEERRDAA